MHKQRRWMVFSLQMTPKTSKNLQTWRIPNHETFDIHTEFFIQTYQKWMKIRPRLNALDRYSMGYVSRKGIPTKIWKENLPKSLKEPETYLITKYNIWWKSRLMMTTISALISMLIQRFSRNLPLWLRGTPIGTVLRLWPYGNSMTLLCIIHHLSNRTQDLFGTSSYNFSINKSQRRKPQTWTHAAHDSDARTPQMVRLCSKNLKVLIKCRRHCWSQ